MPWSEKTWNGRGNGYQKARWDRKNFEKRVRHWDHDENAFRQNQVLLPKASVAAAALVGDEHRHEG